MLALSPKRSSASIFPGRLKWPVIAVLLVLLLAAGRLALFIFAPSGEGRTVRIVNFAKGGSLKSLAGEMEREGVIASAPLFVLYARLNGTASKAQAGTYRFSDAMTPPEILRKLANGDVFEKRFAVPEGYSIYQLAEMLDSRGYFKKKAFLEACLDPGLLQELGINGPSVEGYLYPSTYNLVKIDDPADMIRQMAAQFRKIYDGSFSAAEKKSRLSREQIITLASIVEKEAVATREKPVIASVFLNRIKKGMPLQSDPTSTYGIRAFAGKISGSDVRRDSPYNTYLIRGLPPGPIGNPGADAIEAVLKPAKTPYYYFVARKDGTHQFSRSLDEHNRAVQLYLKGGAPQTGSPELKNDRPNITGRR